ncbi:MAG: hypothetical protein N3B11_03460 [Coriobacteriia bacterium]|nr:hypothetical protein [Coriobacteriia bacterium]
MADKKAVGKKGEKKSSVCGGCKNFKQGKGCSGVCRRKDKKRECTDKACGSFVAR